MEAPLALYRRYRPDSYAQVIGQDHVTEPLRQALRNNRVNHAYLFSGPRGCGKTTSARILARCLNCVQGPTPDPCGECQSCIDLARGGPGSIDVIEIDAASHGGVDDARDLRERAFFSPVSSRYKIYIVDEAHMVTTQGFNALLKLVEEPPDHLKFIFATTEPEKVIGTIRSRTHHYPFRLVPPKLLQDYLADLCAQEGVTVDPAALPLVVRAGGGSVRDTLSVLDQLIGGANTDGVTYAHAVSLLGYTPDSLLDEVVDALSAHDGGSVFGVIDKVIESGQDPKRFGEDLLRRLRDLVVVSAVPDAATRGLLEGPPDLMERLGAQAARFGSAELTRAADVVHSGLTEMRGATAPRLQLELICARILLPAVDDSTQGLHARLDRLERRIAVAGTGPAVAPADAVAPPVGAPSNNASGSRAPEIAAPGSGQAETAPTPQPHQPAADSAPRTPATPETTPAVGSPPAAAGSSAAPGASQLSAVPENKSTATQAAPAPEQPPAARPTGWDVAPPRPAPPAASASAGGAQSGTAQPGTAQTGGAQAGGFGLAQVRQLWPDVLDTVMRKRRFTWILLSQNAQVTAVQGNVLTLGLVNAGARDSFARGGSEDILKEALHEVVGGTWRIEALVDPGAGGSGSGGASGGSGGGGSDSWGGGGSAGGSGSRGGPAGGSGANATDGWGGGPNGSDTAPPAAHASQPAPSAHGTPGGGQPSAQATHSARSAAVAPQPQSGAPPPEPDGWDTPAASSAPATTARASTTPSPQAERSAPAAPHSPAVPDDEVDPDTDAAMTDSIDTQTELLQREFGAELIPDRPSY